MEVRTRAWFVRYSASRAASWLLRSLPGSSHPSLLGHYSLQHIQPPLALMSSGPLSLKQRLAALNISVPNSLSGGRFNNPSSQSPRWRPNFGRRNTVDGTEGMVGHDRIQEVMARVVFQAGVDYESVCYSLRPSPYERVKFVEPGRCKLRGVLFLVPIVLTQTQGRYERVCLT